MNDGVSVAYMALMLILPLSALVARRLPIGDLVKMVVAWIAIFAVLIAGVSLWQRMTTNDGKANTAVTMP